MTIQQRIEIIKQFPLFQTLGEAELKNLAENAKEKSFAPHTLMLSPNQTSEGIYLVHKGLLTIYILTAAGKHIPISFKGPLYIASERNIFDDEREVTMETLKETQTLVLTENDCKNIIMTHPELVFTLLKIVVGKLHLINTKIDNYYSLPLKERTLNTLTELTHYFPQKIITLSQEELADLVGATRARVTEALQELRNQKKIALHYRQITIL